VAKYQLMKATSHLYRIGDAVRVVGDTWFYGATGYIAQVFPDAGSYFVRLEHHGVLIRDGLTLPFAPSELEATRCQHPRVSEAEMQTWIDRRMDTDPPRCYDCNEDLYPDDATGDIRVYVGEPKGAGASMRAW